MVTTARIERITGYHKKKGKKKKKDRSVVALGLLPQTKRGPGATEKNLVFYPISSVELIRDWLGSNPGGAAQEGFTNQVRGSSHTDILTALICLVCLLQYCEEFGVRG